MLFKHLIIRREKNITTQVKLFTSVVMKDESYTDKVMIQKLRDSHEYDKSRTDKQGGHLALPLRKHWLNHLMSIRHLIRIMTFLFYYQV